MRPGFVSAIQGLWARTEEWMRAVLMLLVVVILVALVLVATNVLDIRQKSPGEAPGVTAGKAPAYEVQVNPPRVGTTTTNVQVPVVEMKTKQVAVPTIGTGGGGGNSQ
jgi:hypothetical protein